MNDPNDKTFRQAVTAALPRYRDALDELMAFWREVEPSLRAWVAVANDLTDEDWEELPTSTRDLYETMKRTFAEMDANMGEE